MSSAPGELQPNPDLAAPAGPLVFIILDGVGVGRHDAFDAVSSAFTPVLDKLSADGLYRTLRAHGVAVGLPSDADMGNSEVGHNILGAGRIFDQGAKRVENALDSGSLWKSKAWHSVVEVGRAATLHFVGLASDGNVHSNIAHLVAMLEHACAGGVQRVRVHALLDGRDVPDGTAEHFIADLDVVLQRLNAKGVDYRVASGGGRMTTTMDRYGADWAMVERGWHAHVLGDAPGFPSALAAIAAARAEQPGIRDQNLPSFTVTDEAGHAVGAIHDGDAVVMFNFRGDRALEFSQAITETAFAHFDRVRFPLVTFAGMCLYDGDLGVPKLYLVEPTYLPGTISELLAAAGVRQFACAETQKFGHVTYFWNGNRSEPFDPALETYEEIPSDGHPFETRPWMKSAETADSVIEAVRRGDAMFIRANFAGGDMVGHTAHFAATVLALGCIDLALGRIAASVRAVNGVLVISADHGNADDKVERDAAGNPRFTDDGAPVWRTAHSLNPVPFIISDFSGRSLDLTEVADGGLANVAATLLNLLGFEAPADYEPSLVRASPAS